MSTFLYELPTTGAISFADFLVDTTGGARTKALASATEARANLRAALKDAKRTDGEKDYLRLVKIIDDYIPFLNAIVNCVQSGELEQESEPVFSWRTTISATLLQNSPRLTLPSLQAENAFTLLTLSFVYSNHARVVFPTALPTYESLRLMSEAHRKANDERITFAVSLLRRASGIFSYIAQDVLASWDPPANAQVPPEMTVEVTSALSKMALADAQALAIRKLMSKAASEAALAPGPPLPKSHPSPALLAKLHLECMSWYTSARALIKTSGASVSRGGSRSVDEVHGELRRYLADSAQLHSALARKWLGVDAGERNQSGTAVGLLLWTQSELNDLKDGGKGLNLGGRAKDRREGMKEKVLDELENVRVFLRSYKNVNDTLHFQPIPSQSDLQATIPAGRAAVQITPYEPPLPAFGNGSVELVQEETKTSSDDPDSLRFDSAHAANLGIKPTYAGSGSYY